jgi:hypothetical protein
MDTDYLIRKTTIIHNKAEKALSDLNEMEALIKKQIQKKEILINNRITSNQNIHETVEENIDTISKTNLKNKNLYMKIFFLLSLSLVFFYYFLYINYNHDNIIVNIENEEIIVEKKEKIKKIGKFLKNIVFHIIKSRYLISNIMSTIFFQMLHINKLENIIRVLVNN